MLNLGEKIKEMLNLSDCMIKAYYGNIILKCYSEDEDFMETEVPVSDLIAETDIFSVEEEFAIEVNSVNRNLVITLR